jgi:hypothetical protein
LPGSATPQPPSQPLPQSPPPDTPDESDFDKAVRNRQESLNELETIRNQWKESERTADKNDPGYDALKTQYQNYMDYLKNKADAANAQANAIAQDAVTKANTRVLHGQDGRDYTITFDPTTGKWHNTETGNDFDPDRFDQWQKDLVRDKDFSDKELDKMSKREDAQSQALQAIKDKAAAVEKVQQNLSTMERGIIFGDGPAADLFKPSGEPGNILDHINELRNELKKGQEFDKDKYDRISKVYSDAQSGKTLSESNLPTSSELTRDIISDTVINSVGEVATGQKADGSTSWLGMGARILTAAVTGGVSEVALTPTAALYSMKKYVDNGGDSALEAFRQSVEEVVIGEVSGVAGGYVMSAANIAGKAIGNTLSAAGKRVQGVIAKIDKSLSTGGTTVSRKIPSGPARPSSLGNTISAAEVAEAKAARANARASQIGESINEEGKIANKYSVKPDPKVDVTEQLKGMSDKQRIHVNNVAYKNNAIIDVRPTTKNAPDLIKRGIAEPKIPDVKSKTINSADIHLGAPKDGEGFAGYFCPKKPDPTKLAQEGLDPGKVQEVLDRYAQRMQEYKDQSVHMRDMQRQGKLTVKDGLIYSKNGKPFTGDPDIFEIRDVNTGKPLPRYQIDPKGNVMLDAKGNPKLNPVREQIIKELQQPPLNAQHGSHMDWKYDQLSKKVHPDAPTGANSDYEMGKTIDNGVLNKHREGNEPILSFNGDKSPSASWFEGEKVDCHDIHG